MSEENNQEQINLDDMLNMSDEEFSQLDVSNLDEHGSEEPTETEGQKDPTAEESTDIPTEEEQHVDNEEERTDDDRSVSEGQQSESDDEVIVDAASTPKETKATEPKDVDVGVLTSKAAMLDTIFGEFKANGRTMKVSTPEEVIQLMQMGANYQKKMADLQPMRKVHKLLEQNGLLDEAKLALAIDLVNKKPEAIAKLLKDSEIDAYNLPDADTYSPTNTYIPDSTIAIEDVISDLRATESGNRTLHVITQEWDVNSQGYFADNPNEMRILQQHIESGMFDKVMDIVHRENTLGRIPSGCSMIDAYRTVAAELFKAPPVTENVAKPITRKTVAPKQEQPNTARKAAATPTGNITESTELDLDALSKMSDAEFVNQLNKG